MKTTVKATVILFEKGVKATKTLAESAIINADNETAAYKASYQNLKEMFTTEYPAFTTSVKDRDFAKVQQVVYQCFDATVKQLQSLFPNREKGKKNPELFDLDKYIKTIAEKLQEKGVLSQGIDLLKGYLD